MPSLRSPQADRASLPEMREPLMPDRPGALKSVEAFLALDHEGRVMTLVEDGSFAEYFSVLLTPLAEMERARLYAEDRCEKAETERDRLREGLAIIVKFIEGRHREGDIEYQVALIARAALAPQDKEGKA